MSDYDNFLAKKSYSAVATGIEDPPPLGLYLFPFQQDITRWALRRGRAAVFADTGLGKTRMMLEWARVVHEHTAQSILILTPLAVAAQTVREGEAIGITATLCRTSADLRPGINVTNYDRLHNFNADDFGGVVLDESSCLKDFTSATRNQLIESFKETPFRLACTATPSPNDFTELGNHAEFLGVMTRTEMLAMYFVHDGGSTQDWRIKGHAVKPFWRWVCSWAALVRKPSDLGYEDGAYALPPLTVTEHRVAMSQTDAFKAGQLFATAAQTLNEQRAAKRATIDARVARAASVIAAEPQELWLVWCELNAEGDALADTIPGAVQIAGADDRADKESRLLAFADGAIPVLVSKPSIAGHGMNFQKCARMVFVGVSHSFEEWYQAIRRSWRFGQTRPVQVHVVISDAEGAIVENLKRKQADAARMGDEMSRETGATVREAVRGLVRDSTPYEPKIRMRIPRWLTLEATERVA